VCVCVCVSVRVCVCVADRGPDGPLPLLPQPDHQEVHSVQPRSPQLHVHGTQGRTTTDPWARRGSRVKVRGSRVRGSGVRGSWPRVKVRVSKVRGSRVRGSRVRGSRVREIQS